MEMENTAASTRFHQPHMERKMSAMTCEIFNELRLEGKLCDVVIKVNGFEFNAHKNILCSCSSYFRPIYHLCAWCPWRPGEGYRFPGTEVRMVVSHHVRLALMHAEYFMNNVKMNDYVKDSEECKPVIINALKAMYDLNMNGPSNSDFTNPLTRPRLPYAILFAIGGWSGGSPTNAIEAYDARADRWVNVTCEEESPRAYHGAAYLKGYVYIIGGFDSVDYFNSVKRFDPVKKTWHQVAPMHSRRCYVSVTVLSNFIYAMGGFDGYVRLNTAERYEPETNQWTLIAPMHEQRSDASATTLYGKVGGFDGANRLRSAEAYSPVANTWRTIPTMFNPRSNFGIEVVDDLLFVVGGFNGFTTTFNVECYDEKTDEWYDAHDMSIYRSALSCCVVPGLANVGEYAARRDNFTGLALRDEVKYSASTSTLPV
ncbi:hypothetical protein NN561_016406 [Cricetulus griseus]